MECLDEISDARDGYRSSEEIKYGHILDNSRMISLNLTDLKSMTTYDQKKDMELNSSSIPVPVTHTDEYLQSQFQELNKYETNYQNSLEILLNKAQGTAYEAVIRKLYQEKENYGQLDYDREEYSIQRKNTTYASSPKVAFQEKSMNRSGTPVSQEEQRRVIDTLAKPLPRNMWKGSPLKGCVTTNTKGRQRPPPRDTYHADLPEDYNTSRPSMSVSIKDFNHWLAQNKKWSQYKSEKLKKMDEKHQEEISATLSQPKIDPHSVRLARRRSCSNSSNRSRTGIIFSHMSHRTGTENETSTSHVDIEALLETPVRKIPVTPHSPIVSSRGHKRTADRTSDTRSICSENDAYSSVFDRLYHDADKPSHKSLRWIPPEPPFPFSPRICPKSSEIIENRKQKVLSLTSPTQTSRGAPSRSMSPVERQREAERIHKERRDFSRRNDEKRWIPGGEKNLSDHSSGGKIYPTENRYCPPSSKKVAIKVKDLLSDTREISRKRAEEINRERTVYRLDTLPSGERMFQPRIQNKESERIMSRLNESFEDRVHKSVENYFIKKKLSKDAPPSPGPGYYNNISKSNSFTPLRSPLTAAHKDHQSSPGKGGYTFKKEMRQNSLSSLL